MNIMETRENLSLPKNEEHDTKKYTKHINDLIEDAEIEAEIEAEKKSFIDNNPHSVKINLLFVTLDIVLSCIPIESAISFKIMGFM